MCERRDFDRGDDGAEQRFREDGLERGVGSNCDLGEESAQAKCIGVEQNKAVWEINACDGRATEAAAANPDERRSGTKCDSGKREAHLETVWADFDHGIWNVNGN